MIRISFRFSSALFLVLPLVPRHFIITVILILIPLSLSSSVHDVSREKREGDEELPLRLRRLRLMHQVSLSRSLPSSDRSLVRRPFLVYSKHKCSCFHSQGLFKPVLG